MDNSNKNQSSNIAAPYRENDIALVESCVTPDFPIFKIKELSLISAIKNDNSAHVKNRRKTV